MEFKLILLRKTTHAEIADVDYSTTQLMRAAACQIQ